MTSFFLILLLSYFLCIVFVVGAAILFAVLLVAAVTAINNYRKESQFRKLNAVKDDITVGVIRDGLSINVNVKELVVGDIIRLNAGDRVPCDGNTPTSSLTYNPIHIF